MYHVHMLPIKHQLVGQSLAVYSSMNHFQQPVSGSFPKMLATRSAEIGWIDTTDDTTEMGPLGLVAAFTMFGQ